ncbi:BppU family phage baseplate upper protein [Clostridium perfringens]|uniref:BppU family phage baseplate upper protein n=1 Tax=Clostridium perfringens TaxID=1502 RepID=UPI002341EF04|nr:BppU family phage baseplate upper protein [Clostridium perfringens]MDC4245304.1 phage baseplate upper protein [Clostridium perfringens]
MEKIFINVDSYNNEGIKTIQGNNNAETYKIYLLKNKIRLSLVNKTVKLGYVMAGTTKGDIIEDLNITNAEQGEITFPITNKISKKDGVYTCQLAIYGADGFLEYTATFGLTVQANIFTKIAEEIENSKDLTYIERILEEAINTSEELKSNIPVARQLNSDLENQNRILNENMDRANGVNNTLITTTEQSKVAATDAIEKKSQLENSIVEAKKFIDGLDGSQDIPGIRMELTELQNGLKSNQALEYSGSSISANDTLEGRTEGMKIKGKTLLNIHSKSNYSFATSIPQENYTLSEGQNFCEVTIKKYPSSSYYYINAGTINFDLLKPNQKYTLLAKATDGLYPSVMTGGYEFPLTSGGTSFKNGVATMTTNNLVNGSKGQILYINLNGGATYKQELRDVMIFEGDLSIIPGSYFEGIKSFGEAEQEGDKYKISILSSGLNRCTDESINGFININVNNAIQPDTTAISYIAKVYKGGTYYLSKTGGDRSVLGYFKSYPKIGDVALNVASGSITVPSYGYIVAYVSSNKNTNNPTNIIISENINANFQPYKEDKKDILISAPLPGFDFGEDIMYEDNGQVKITRNIDTYTFTGDETMRDTTEQDEKSGTGKYKVFVLTINKTIDKNKNINNNFPKKQFSVAFQKVDSEGLAITQYGIYIKILKSKLSTQDAEGLKAWLKANQTVIYFSRATPVTETVENCVDIDLDTYQEKTYFNILNSLPGTLDFKVPSNIGSIVQNMAKEVNNIWDVINNLLVPSIVKANGNIAMIKLNNNLK